MGEATAMAWSEDEGCGLRGYPYYHKTLSGVKKFGSTWSRWEEPFWDGLCHRLRAAGIPAETEVRYPESSKRKTRCDIVVYPESPNSVWVEGKLLMEHCVYEEYIPYWQKTKLKPGEWEKALLDIGGKDIPKLKGLTRRDATYIGLLVLGFGLCGGDFEQDRFHSMWPTELMTQWQSLHPTREGIRWPDQFAPAKRAGFSDRLWFWYREACG